MAAKPGACLKHLLVTEDLPTRSGGSTVEEPLFTHIEVSALSSPLRGVQVYGLRMTARNAIEVPGTKGSSNYCQDYLGFVVGPAVITLNAVGDPRPFPSTTERRLLSLLYSPRQGTRTLESGAVGGRD
jgi:hypothetical protein